MGEGEKGRRREEEKKRRGEGVKKRRREEENGRRGEKDYK